MSSTLWKPWISARMVCVAVYGVMAGSATDEAPAQEDTETVAAVVSSFTLRSEVGHRSGKHARAKKKENWWFHWAGVGEFGAEKTRTENTRQGTDS